MTDPDPRHAAVLAANTRFYKAFEALNPVAMREVWATDDDVLCIHPGWPACRGAEDIEESWRRIFENTPYIEFEITVLVCGVSGERGWVVCEEAILQSNPEGLSRSLVLATNQYVERDGGWLLTLHHGSPVVQPRALPNDL